jgi:hypothetical protein
MRADDGAGNIWQAPPGGSGGAQHLEFLGLPAGVSQLHTCGGAVTQIKKWGRGNVRSDGRSQC